MTSYLLGDVKPCAPDTNTFIPHYEHYYEEKIPKIYIEQEFYKDDGTVVIRKFDLVRQIFVD